MANLTSRVKNAWNAFVGNESSTWKFDYGPSYSIRQDRKRYSRGNERSIVTSVYTRIANDASSIDIRHVRLDDQGRYIEDIDDSLNQCLSVEANIDQTGRELVRDIVASMLDEGCVAVVPVDTNVNPHNTESYDILSLRTGKIKQWYPSYIKVEVYNDRTGKKEEIFVDKSKCAIIENPFYSVMNETNSTIQRLIHKLNLLDNIDEQSSSGKLDLIIQLPYVVKSEARKKQAEERRKDIEMQLSGSKYGIAYTDGTEKIQQLNRPIENNLMKQIEYLTNMMYGQLGISQSVLDGTADANTMNNYYRVTIEPIMTAIVEEMRRKFLSKTARTQRQSIVYFRNPFKLIPVNELAEIADKFTRNEIATSNEFRQVIGFKPSNDPNADQLRNSNIRDRGAEPYYDEASQEGYDEGYEEDYEDQPY